MNLYEMVVDFKSGKPLNTFDSILRKSKVMGVPTIKNSVSNMTPIKDKTDHMMAVQRAMLARKNSSKVFFKKFDIMNPFKMLIVYGRCHMTIGKFKQSQGQLIVLRELPMEFSFDFHIDLYANNERSYLFSSAFRRLFDVSLNKPRLSNYSQFVFYDYPSWHIT